MFEKKEVTVIVLAAGKGSRMKTQIPKQFIQIGGETILEKTVGFFQNNQFVDKIIAVAGKDYLEFIRDLCGKFDKFAGAVEGGIQRQDSVNAGLQIVEDGIVLIHDGARPFLNDDIICRVIEKTVETGAAIAVVPCKDTVRRVLNVEEGEPGESITLDRSTLYNVQTPQGFDTALIKKAFEKAYAEGFYGTDDSVLVERLGHSVSLVNGSYENIKITTKEDLPMEIRTGSGYDVHRFSENRELWLCGVEIPYEKGLLGHSDADVATHALMDAILGAAALGDIGLHFPDTDERYKGISSMKLLAEVNKLIGGKGFTFGNGDITIIAQEPKIAPYILKMRQAIAETLDVNIDKINIKGTTTEKLGFVGRKEGIAAEAVCILYKR